MASVLNRTTKQYLSSVNTPDYNPAEWIISPDVSAVIGWDTKYWEISGDNVSLADLPTRNAIDAAELTARLDATADSVDGVGSFERALVKLIVGQLNVLRAQHGLADITLAQAKTALRNELES